MLAIIASIAGRHDIRGGITSATRHRYFMLSYKIDTRSAAIMASVVMIFEDSLPLFLSKIVGKISLARLVLLNMVCNKAWMIGAILALILSQLVPIQDVLFLIALLLPCSAFISFVSGVIFLYEFRFILLIAIFGLLELMLMFRVIVRLLCATITKPVAVMWPNFSALFTFANLARFYIFVVARITQTARANFHQALAFHTHTDLPLLFHDRVLKSGAPLVPAALLFRQHQLENAGRVDKQNPLDWLRCLNALSIAPMKA